LKTKKPSAIIYGWDRVGTYTLISDIYFEEKLYDEVIVYSLEDINNVVEDYTKYKPDIILSFGSTIEIPIEYLRNIHFFSDKILPDNVIANDVVCKAVQVSCKVNRPKFSIFTPTYQTGDRIFRTYESLKNQTLDNWEWVVVDDSPDNDTYDNLNKIAEKDYRVKVHKIFPISNGNVGLVKHRAAMLCDGDWLVELDHDDTLTNECLLTCYDAILKYPDAGFLYSNCCELYDDGEFRSYDHDWSGNWYGRDDNFFDFGYAGHTIVNVDGKELLAHWYPDVNPLTIRFNISMPNHIRMWERNLYHKIGGHNKTTPVADDLEIIMRTFLNTRMIHVKRVLYLQYNNRNSTVDNNSVDINRRARLIKDYYDLAIHKRIQELGFHDWNWIEEKGHSRRCQNDPGPKFFGENEQIMNYIYE
jgi:glycosyltransferase involved in cell wall biosynthesis